MGTFNGIEPKDSFSWGLSLGLFLTENVELDPGRGFGLRLQGGWTPTYIRSDAAGWWCDPLWGCYVLSNAQYANQLELSGGISLRF